ncbi:hypothetical protein EI94DRAFT_868682 [Lactarius quietus]|nr:hypothetical protein EI94DRAFT_868682 [Lactarius quietus]
MHIQCTNGTPIVDILDHIPPLPLLLDYSGTITELDELGIYHALRLHDRVRRIDLHLLPSILHKYLALMDEHFPILEHLSLSFTAEKFATLTLPKPFRAPNLRHLDIPGIGSPKRLRLLISTVSLVTLALRNIQTSSYFRPRLLVARLGSLPQLEELSIGFSIPIPRPNAEIELFGELGATVTLPNLKTLMFRGVSAYLESLVAQIRVPLLGTLDITLFNQTAFALPHLSHLINNTEGFMLPAAKVYFNHDGVSIIMAQPGSRWFDGPFRLRVMCKQLDWQIDCAAQICSTLVHTLSGVELCTLDPYTKTLPSELKNGEIDSTTWQELLRSFIGLKELYVYGGLLEELSRALLADGVGAEPGFLPGLQSIVAEDNLFARFINARRAVGHPVLFLPSP